MPYFCSPNLWKNIFLSDKTFKCNGKNNILLVTVYADFPDFLHVCRLSIEIKNCSRNQVTSAHNR